MEPQQIKHIEKHLLELIDNTVYNATIQAFLQQNNVLGKDDISHLESIGDKRWKVLKFYQLIEKKADSYAHVINALDESCQPAPANILKALDVKKYDVDCPKPCSSKSITQQNFISLPVAMFDVLNPTSLFTGRKNELVHIRQKLQHAENRMASIVGLGGIGKTELARRYIQDYGKNYYQDIIWIRAETEEMATESFRRLATDFLGLSLINVDGKEKSIISTVNEVYNIFCQKKCLFVFDNFECSPNLHKFLPLGVTNGPHVLITSRDTDLSLSVETLKLHEMKEHEAIQFVKSGLKIEHDNEDEALKQLVKTLQGFPLALLQAISYIKQQQKILPFTISQYLELYGICSEKLLGSNLPTIGFNIYSKTTLTTWTMTTDLISADKDYGRDAIRMLNIISYFQPDKIATKILLPDNVAEKNSEREDQSGVFSDIMHHPWVQLFLRKFRKTRCLSVGNVGGLQLLVKYSMVNAQPTQHTISIHRLVQEVTRIGLRHKKLEETTLREISNIFSGRISHHNIEHVRCAFEYTVEHESLRDNFQYISDEITKVYLHNNEINKCLNIIHKRLNLAKQKPENTHKYDEILQCESMFTFAKNQTQNAEYLLKNLEREILRLAQNASSLYSDAAISFIQMRYVVVSLRIGNRKECLEMLFKIYQILTSRWGPTHFRTLDTLVHIIACLHESGHFKNQVPVNAEYLQLLKEENIGINATKLVSLLNAVYENYKRWITANPFEVLIKYKIAYCFFQMGEYDLAKVIASDIYERGKSSTDQTIRMYAEQSLAMLGIMSSKTEIPDEKIATQKRIPVFYSCPLGNFYPNTLSRQQNTLAQLHHSSPSNTEQEGGIIPKVLDFFETYNPYLKFILFCLLCKQIINLVQG